MRLSGRRRGPIVVGSEIWIARGAIVVGSITIGDGATLGANAVVTRDVSAGGHSRRPRGLDLQSVDLGGKPRFDESEASR